MEFMFELTQADAEELYGHVLRHARTKKDVRRRQRRIIAGVLLLLFLLVGLPYLLVGPTGNLGYDRVFLLQLLIIGVCGLLVVVGRTKPRSMANAALAGLREENRLASKVRVDGAGIAEWTTGRVTAWNWQAVNGVHALRAGVAFELGSTWIYIPQRTLPQDLRTVVAGIEALQLNARLSLASRDSPAVPDTTQSSPHEL